MRWTFDVHKFCPEHIATAAVNRFATCMKKICNYGPFLKSIDMTDQEFKDAIADAIHDVANIKNSTIELTIGGKDFTLEVTQNGAAILLEV